MLRDEFSEALGPADSMTCTHTGTISTHPFPHNILLINTESVLHRAHKYRDIGISGTRGSDSIHKLPRAAACMVSLSGIIIVLSNFTNLHAEVLGLGATYPVLGRRYCIFTVLNFDC